MIAKTISTSGWTKKCVQDALETGPRTLARCELCGTSIRRVHVLQNEKTGQWLSTGGCCAAHLIDGYDARGEERELANRARRLARFLNPKGWRASRNNPANICRNVPLSDGCVAKVTVFLRDRLYRVSISLGRLGTIFHPDKHRTQEEAKQAAFDMLESRDSE